MKLVSALAVSSLVLGACATHQGPPVQNGDPALGTLHTRTELTKYFRMEPKHCAEVRDGFELCDWFLGGRSPAYTKLATQLDTGERVSVLCELPTDGSTRTPGSSCSVVRHQQNELAVKGGRASLARQEFAQARTALELGRSIGVAPNVCTRLEGDTLECTWDVHRVAPGYVKAVWAFSKADPFIQPGPRLNIACRLPLAGSARGQDSCTVSPTNGEAAQTF